MNGLIEVFRMTEIAPKKRAKVIIELGRLIIDQQGGNVTETLVYELVKMLDPENQILSDPHYKYFADEE